MIAGPFADGVTFAAGALPGILRSIVEESPSGRVRVIQRRIDRYVYYDGGNIVSLVSRADDERLGNWLLGRGLVNPRAFAEAMQRRPFEVPIATYLTQQRLLDGRTLQDELETLTLMVAGRMLFEAGECNGEAGKAVPQDAVTLAMTPTTLFAKTARRTFDLRQLERFVGGGKKWWLSRSALAGNVGVSLDEKEALVMSQLDAERTLEELCVRVPIPPQEIWRALTVLAVAGAAESASETPAGPEAPPTDHDAATGALDTNGYHERMTSGHQPPESVRADGGAFAAPDSAGGGGGAHGAVPMYEESMRRADQLKAEAYGILDSGGDPRPALKLLLEAVDIAPDALSLTRLAEMELANPLWRQRALDHLKHAVELDPKHTPAWLALANYWGLRSQPDKQRRCLEKILTYEAGNAAVREALQFLDGKS